MCVVPVKIREEGTNQDFHTLAMLDNCSQGTFVTEDLLKKLEIPGTPTRITIKTLSGETSIDSTTVTGLEVSSSEDSKMEILERIKQEICQNDEEEIGILIGANCMKGLEPTEIISSRNGGPYAFKTRLGWCVVGPLQSNHKISPLACHKILVNEKNASEKFQPHCFAVCARIKDRCITDLLEKIYRNDFTEPQLPLTNSTIRGAAEEVSQNDLKFLKLMNKKVKKIEGHYMLPLPLKNPDAKLPNNRKQAEHRLKRLKKRFQKDQNFFSDYKAFMEEMIDKGYAQRSTSDLCADGGFNLTKFISNDKEVLKSIPEEKRRKNVKEFEITDQTLPTDKALGVVWNVEEDHFCFQVELKEKPVTRRVMLSLLSTVYDPCGFVSPFILQGRRIIQQTCRQEAGWDDPLPVAVVDEWLSWCTTLENLRNFKIDRCYKAPDFNRVIHCSLHHFSDASESGYGQVSYLRFLNEDGMIHCSMVMGKSTVAPLKYISMPRLELTAAVLSVKVSTMIRTELEYTIHKEVFWSDSQVVLSYIRNTEKRFKTFIANRIQYINDHTKPKQWCYIPSQMNLADCSSRGFSKKTNAKHDSQVQQWFNGPAFLWQATSQWPRREMNEKISEDDPELKTEVHNFKIAMEEGNILESLEARISEWEKMKRVMVHVLKFVKKIRLTSGETTTVKEYRHDGLLRVGGRIKRADLEYDVIHPILLPKKAAVTTLIIRNCHSKVAHGGRNLTLNETHPGTLNDESLSTLMAEAEAIINSRPLTVETISDVNSLQPLSPNTLLTQKTNVVMPPPGSFSRPDQYSRKQWRRVGDIVLMKSEAMRCEWPLARITQIFPDELGNVRKAEIQVANNGGKLQRPITKLVLIMESGV
eukprot:gene2302-2651_t